MHGAYSIKKKLELKFRYTDFTHISL
jgi:hypothetical protein